MNDVSSTSWISFGLNLSPCPTSGGHLIVDVQQKLEGVSIERYTVYNNIVPTHLVEISFGPDTTL
jgi:hypothetical protein